MKSLWNKIAALSIGARIGAAVVLIVVLAVVIHVATRSHAPAPEGAGTLTYVSVASAGSLTASSTTLSLVGTVTSVNQATILAQTSGEIVSLNRALGDVVNAGDVIAQFDNASARAALLQAQGALSGAEAALATAEGATAPNATVASNQAAQSAANAALSTETALQSAYAALDDAIHTKADTLFSNPRSDNPQITLVVPDSILVSKLTQERMALEAPILSAQAISTHASTQTLSSDVSAVTATLQKSVSFLNDLITAVNETPVSQTTSATQLAGYQALLSAARTEVTATLAQLTGAKSAYDAATSGAVSAATIAGSASDSGIKAAQAMVTQSQGAVAAAQAALEKTIVRSPISGTIVSLPITQGGFVSSFAPVAIVSNPHALYVDTEVTGSDALTLSIGDHAVMNGDPSLQGKVTFIAPALDPSTGKREVKIGIMGDATQALSSGEVVSVVITRSMRTAAPAAASGFSIPIVAVNMTPDGPVVFTVTASSTLEAHPIVLGAIAGDTVSITSGIVPALQIVTDARGLSNGEAVIVSPDPESP